jgi:O-acetyl-ADP-ribose deacetylase (regulator of RNase III)
MQIHNATLEVTRASVLQARTQAIVNAANTMMRGGGGVDGVIHMATGPALLEELRRLAPRGAATAEVVVTRGHNLPHEFILHVAGPIYRNHAPEEAARLLRACYQNCLEDAEERGLESLAFPSISTGAYGYPLQAAAALAIETARKYLQDSPRTSLKRIEFAMFGSEEFAVFSRYLGALEYESP